MTPKRNLPLLLFATFTLFLGSCVPLTPAPSAYPNPPSLLSTISPKQVARNEAVLAIARPLIEKANKTYLIPGWIHFEIRTEITAPLPEGSSAPKEWRDETWALLDENGEAFQSITFHDTGNVKTSYITAFQDGSWRGLTNGSVSDFQGSTYPVPLDINFLEVAEYYINAVELGYDEMDTMNNEHMAVFTLPNTHPVEINSGQAGQLTRAGLTKYYFSITSGLLMKIEEYSISSTGPIQTLQRIITLVENVEQPPAKVLKYLAYASMTPAVSAYPSPLPTINPLRPLATPTNFQLPFNDRNVEGEYCQLPPVQLPISKAKDLSDDEIAGKLMELLLAYFNAPQAPDWCRIDGYKIDKVSYNEHIPSLPLEPKGDIMRVVQFSIKLVQIPNFWMSWSGDIDQRNWLHTGQTVAVFRSTAGYTIKFANP